MAKYDDFYDKKEPYLPPYKEEFSVLSNSQKQAKLDREAYLEEQAKKDEENRERIKEIRKKLEKEINAEEMQLNSQKSSVDKKFSEVINGKTDDIDSVELQLKQLKASQNKYDSDFDKTLFYVSREREEFDLQRRYANYESMEDTINKQIDLLKLKSEKNGADISKDIEKLQKELKQIDTQKETIKKDLTTGESLSQKQDRLLYKNDLAINYSNKADKTDKLIYENKYAKSYANKANKKDDTLYKNKYAKKYSDFATKIDKVLYENGTGRKIGQTLNKMSAARNRIAKKAVNAAKRNFKQAFEKIKHFLLMTNVGRLILVLLILFFTMAGSLTPQTKQPEGVSIADCMMTAWIDIVEETAVEFYDKYHQNIPTSDIIPIIYTFLDDERLEIVFASQKERFNLEDYPSQEDYYLAVSRNTVKEFLKDMDMLSVRELFLDEVKFETQYINYIWSNWITTGSTNDTVNLDNDTLERYSARLLEEASSHGAYKAYTSTVKTTKTVDDYGWVEHCYDERKLVNGRYTTVKTCSSNYEKIGSHIERGTANVTRYDYKNLVSKEWVNNISSLDDADKWNDNGTATWLIGDPTYEDEFDSIVGMPWEFVALVNGDGGFTYKEIHYWTLRPAYTDIIDPTNPEVSGEFDDSVYHDIVYEYNPNTNKAEYLFCANQSHNHTTHIGSPKTGSNGAYYTDVITLSKKVDISGTINGDKYRHSIPIELNRNIIYSYFYKLTDDTKPNEFTEMYLPQWYAKMIYWANIYADIMETYVGNPTMLIDMLSGEYYPREQALGIWAQIKKDVEAAKKLGQSIGGYDMQCTQYANWRLYKEYGIYGNYGHGKDTATHAVENSNISGNQKLIYSKEPKAGSMFSYRSEPYGHTGWVEDYYQESGEWYIVISDGNVNHGGIRLNAKYKYSDWVAK